MKGRIQIPSNPDNWLYQDWDENTRIFTKEAFLAPNQADLPECTNEGKEQWEKEHQPEPEPEQEK